ncbi:MAG: type IV pilus biogenesis/stability protein PilW [Hydrogenophilaceae bacterium]|nr:type IV pilus biogenesis/stability protein PilW [Hydrogenophilaceae bacterium]
MLRLAALLMLGLLAACAQTPSPSSSTAAELASDSSQRAQVHTELAAHYYTRGQYAVALSELRIALEDNPRYAPAYNMLGLVHTELREFAQAEANYRRAVELMPNYSDVRNNFGYFLCQRGRHAEGLLQFDVALQNPLYASPDKALANAGACSLAMGDLNKAEDYLQRALARVPGHPVALQAMAELYFRRGHYLGAQSALLKLGETNELDAAALWLGVRVERKLGDAAAEASYGAQLRRRFPDAAQTKRLMSGDYEGAGQ